MSIFDGIENATVGGDGNWVRPGRYQAEIQSVRLVTNFKKLQRLAIDLKVIKVIDDDNGKGHKEGEEFVHMLMVEQPSFLGNVKQFVSSTLGCSPDDVGKAEADRVTSDEQPLSGIVVELEARNITTKAGNPFTKVTYKGEVTAVVDEAEANA